MNALIAQRCEMIAGWMGSFVRSVNLDRWTKQHLEQMRVGGNDTAEQFFREYGVPDGIDFQSKYNNAVQR
jgi:hypothetical protein